MKRLLVIALLATACDGGTGATSNADAAAGADGSSAEDAATPDTATPDATPDAAASDAAEPDAAEPLVCNPPSQWVDQPAFQDATNAMGLTGINGVRLSAADLDGDGYPDLVVRGHVLGVHDSFEPGGERHTFVMMNRPAPSGGRHFEDATEASGFLALPGGGTGRTAHIVVFGDVDNDGDLDAFSGVSVSPDPAQPDNGDRNELLLNAGDGTFTLAPGGDVRHENKRYAAGGASFLDADRDGLLDLFVGYGNGATQPDLDRLYAGDGAGSLKDITKLAGMQTLGWTTYDVLNSGDATRNTWGTTVCDVDDDGWPDVLTATYGRFWNGLWKGGFEGGLPHFTDRSVASGYGMDARVDWRTNFNAQCYCQLVPEAEDCAGVPAPPNFISCTDPSKLRWSHDTDRMPWRLGGNTFSTACADVDDDGDMDLVNYEIVHWDVGESSDPMELLLNDGTGTFTYPGNDAMGLARSWDGVDWNAGDMTGAIFDFDNDGHKDIYVGSSDYPGTRGFLFHQGDDGLFEEVPPALGINHARSHGIAVADFDRDGDLDVVVGHGTSRCSGDPTCYPSQEVHYFRNDLGQGGNYLQVRLQGGASTNRAAIGARVQVTADGHTQTQEVGGGYGHFGIQNDVVLHFGLGAACAADITVRWPDAAGTTESWSGVAANRRVRLDQGAAEAHGD